MASSVTLFHSSPHINQMLPQVIHMHFCLVEILPNYVLDFQGNWIEVMAVRWRQIWRDGGWLLSAYAHDISSDTSDQERGR